MKTSKTFLLLLVVIFGSFGLWTIKQAGSQTADQAAVAKALDQSKAIQSTINGSKNNAQAAAADMAVTQTTVDPVKAAEAQHLLNAVQGVLDQYSYTLKNSTTAK